ncbi:PPOX class F420-dependent oxidoreductase [Streptomyces sp. JNUCC 64]
MSVVLDRETRALLDGPNFATVATLDRDGGPHTSLVWIARDPHAPDTVVFSTTAARRKARNLARDPRISLTVFDLANPYRSVDIRGTAELVEDPHKELPRELARRYLGQDPPPESDDVRRLVVRVTPLRVTSFSV